MENTIKIKKNTSSSSSPAWHIGAQAFIALLIILIVPLAINIKTMISGVISNTHTATKEPKKVVVEPQKKNTLTRFLAAAVFGVDPDTNVVENPETGAETIILPYGGETNSGGVVPGSGNVQSDRWINGGPNSDGSIPVTDKNLYPLPNAGGTQGGGNIQAGGFIQSGGSI